MKRVLPRQGEISLHLLMEIIIDFVICVEEERIEKKSDGYGYKCSTVN